MCICMVSNNQIPVQISEKTPTLSIDKHKTSSYNEYTICKFHTLPKYTITDRSGMILLQKSEKGQNLTVFRKNKP